MGDFLKTVWEEWLTRMVDGVQEAIAAAKSIKREEKNLVRFSELIRDVEKLLNQQPQHQGGQLADVIQANFFCRLEEVVNNARKIIERYKSESWFGRMFDSVEVDSQLNQSSKEITELLDLLRFIQINKGLDISDKVDEVRHSVKSMVFRHEVIANAIHSSPEGSPSSNRVFPIETPEVQLIHNGINVPQNFLCPLSKKIMEDPVSVSCNHSYERKEIEKHFRLGHVNCIVCDNQLSSTNGELDLKPNSTHRESISEWKQTNSRIEEEKNAKKKLRECSARITPYSVEFTIQALEDLHSQMVAIPSCVSEATESSCKLHSKLAELLKEDAATTSAALRCLLLIARFSDKNKETIGKEGVIKCLLKQENENEVIAIEVLLELSKNNIVAQKIIKSETCLSRLVFLLSRPSSLGKMAQAVLKNLPNDDDSTIKTAKFGYLAPFLDRFNSKGTSEESRALMAEKLAEMKLTETAVCCLENELFITNLSVMLDCNLPAVKSASLKCIKWLTLFDGLRSWILSSGYAIPTALLCLIMDTDTEKQWKQEALDILISLIEIDQPLGQQSNQCLGMICSCNRIQDLVDQIKTSTHEDQILLLQLLMAIVKKSGTALYWVISNENAMNCLYSSLSPNENGDVRLNALKLISYISGNNSINNPLPPNPTMGTALCNIIAVLEKGGTEEEVSMAAKIVSRLPRSDRSVNLMLQSSSVIEAIKIHISDANKSHELIENVLEALLRCMDQSDSRFLMQFGKLEQPLVQMLSIGSPLAKRHAAAILAHLARCTPQSSTPPSTSTHSRWHSWPFSSSSTDCTVHKSSCLVHRILCLAKAGAVGPLVSMVNPMNPDAAEAALTALQTLFETDNLEPGASETSLSAAASAIVENKGMAAILEVLERGPVPVKKAALELVHNIYRHRRVTKQELSKFRAILSHLLNEGAELSKKARILLSEMV